MPGRKLNFLLCAVLIKFLPDAAMVGDNIAKLFSQNYEFSLTQQTRNIYSCVKLVAENFKSILKFIIISKYFTTPYSGVF